MRREDELKNQIRLEGFPAKVRSQLQLIWRYFKNIDKDPEESSRFAIFIPSDVEIRSATPKLLGQIVDGFFLPEDDFHAIYDSVESVLEEIRDIINSIPDVRQI